MKVALLCKPLSDGAPPVRREIRATVSILFLGSPALLPVSLFTSDSSSSAFTARLTRFLVCAHFLVAETFFCVQHEALRSGSERLRAFHLLLFNRTRLFDTHTHTQFGIKNKLFSKAQTPLLHRSSRSGAITPKESASEADTPEPTPKDARTKSQMEPCG